MEPHRDRGSGADEDVLTSLHTRRALRCCLLGFVMGTFDCMQSNAAPVPAVPQGHDSCRADAGVIDLTVPLPPATRGGGFPGGVYGGDSSQRGPRLYSLPLSVTIAGTEPASLSMAGALTVCLHVENSGSRPFDFPTSRDLFNTHKDGNKNRRTLQIRLRVEVEGVADPNGVLSAVLASSSSVPDSFVRLAPGETINIKLTEKASTLLSGLPDGIEEIPLKVAISEWTSEDNRYFIPFHDGRSETVLSTDPVTLSVAPESP